MITTKAFFSIILALAVAVGTAEARAPSGTVAAFGILPNPNLPQVVLYDQYNNASVTATRSSTFTDFPQR